MVPPVYLHPSPVTPMRLSPILLSVALLCASGQVLASESRQLGPEGDGSCPETSTATSESPEDADAAAAPARRTQKAKPTPAARASGNGGGQRSSAPRWHSFLPGMFR